MKATHLICHKMMTGADAAGNLKPLPGFLQFLDWIKASGRPFAAVSNAPKANCIAMLKGIGATEYFPKIVLGEECVRPKPFPEPYLEGLKLIHRQPHECLAFEDSPSGDEQQANDCKALLS